MSIIKKIAFFLLMFLSSAFFSEVYGKSNVAPSYEANSNHKYKTSVLFNNDQECITNRLMNQTVCFSSFNKFSIYCNQALCETKIDTRIFCKPQKLKRKWNKLGKAHYQFIHWNPHVIVDEYKHIILPSRSISNLLGYQKVYDRWCVIEITPD